ncbi:UNVERIFIED_CONTAM: hypothetical protein K2H54_033146 [Gekko kuhli]
MNKTNRLTSSDNVGYAAYLLEQEKNKGYLSGEGPYVAALGSANLGDVSPNTKGPHCINTGESCENLHNYCPVGGAKMCIASGPGHDMLESTKLIGRNIYLKAKELSSAAYEEINGPLSSAHQWVDMSNVTLWLNATHSELEAQGRSGTHVILAGVCNVYTHYITTFEEYQDTVQELPKHPKPDIFNTTSINFLLPVIDTRPIGRKYGDVLQDVEPIYRVGEVARAHFVGANPRNSVENVSKFTFLTVEKYDSLSANWETQYNDASWDTRFLWEKGDWGKSTAIVEWHIPNNTEPGTYRLRYFGHHQEFLRPIQAFSGISSVFEVSDLEVIKL